MQIAIFKEQFVTKESIAKQIAGIFAKN
ncbi:hypothetical protein NO2_1465, partial [Candidatus Termititenax persephonae]